MRTRHEVEAIDAARHVVTVRNLDTDEVFEEPYDKPVSYTHLTLPTNSRV